MSRTTIVIYRCDSCGDEIDVRNPIWNVRASQLTGEVLMAGHLCDACFGSLKLPVEQRRRGRKRSHTKKSRNELIIELSGQGISTRELSERFNLNASSIRRIVTKAELQEQLS